MEIAPRRVEVLQADPRLRVTAGPEHLVLPDGLQPSLLVTARGALIVQAQLTKKPHPAARISYPSAIGTAVSRDGGTSWSEFSFPPGENGLNLEGGGWQFADGTILGLDTYITPGARPGEGFGQIYESTDDWQTLSPPIDITLHIPGVDYYVSTDDYGRKYEAHRFHRRMLALPNGDLLATTYGCFVGDNTPFAYVPTAKKCRSALVRSTNRGRHWELVNTIAVDPTVGTEGFCEPVLGRISQGPHAGRLRCYMRTGFELFETQSDDEGRTWTKARPMVFPGLDVHRTADWAAMFADVRDHAGRLLAENPVALSAAQVDPDLIELRSGVLVCAFGMRVPSRACWPLAQHPLNGNYLAFSLDHGDTWSHLLRLSSGTLTTHYMAIEETPVDGEIFVAYDVGDWSSGHGRDICGRTLQVTLPAP
ncbi:MAG: sialidase family protein [Opitutales bacterium]